MNVALSPRQEAELRQAEASDPTASAWVGASAGSGKTKVLTDRVLRLLLTPGQSPARILCLTFTKAAAAEMATRLARELGRWVSMPEGALAQRLAALLGRVPSRGDLDLARRLFAQVLELPGGMRISTIHAFCQSLLRAFPLEAGLAPQFGVVEEADAAALLAECREAVLAAPGGQVAALQALAGLVPPEAFATLVRALVGDRQRLAAALRRPGAAEGLGAALARHLGLEEDAQDELVLLRRACAACPDLVAIARLKQASKGDSDRARAERMLAWLAHEHEVRATRWDGWSSIYLTQEGKRRADSGLATKTGLKTAFEQVLAAMRAEADRVLAVEESRRACRLLSATRALIGLGAPVLERYAARKAVRGLLDYDDLILAAQRVLEDPGSAWVLFKLDGGLDHVLLDEAQDSNPAQWGIAAALTEDFFAGAGAERRGAAERIGRTVFAVGDIKQAIYGFQGADSAGFATWKAHFARGAAAIGAELRDVRLNVSFRSTAPVLALVDAVFADGPARDGVMPPGEALSHRPDRLGHAGCVELWPMLEAAETEPPPPWAPPEQPTGSEGPDALLAEAVAARIAGWIGREPLPARDRTIRAGDILVLVRRRTGGFVPRLIRALKERNVQVGGADRMRLTDQIAVQDLLALGDVLLLPEDDLALATVLKSPLLGLDEDQLYVLAHGRPGTLWARLAAERDAEGPVAEAARWIARLMGRADLVTPHALYAEVLGELRGRERLLARLGPDAADPVDEFLNAALAFERSHPPSLQGFVHWVRQGSSEVKREQEEAGDAVRIMTVHGAKGLQAPVVILPDTVASGRDKREVRWDHGPDGLPLPLWAPNQDHQPPLYREALERERQARREEENRLLYVALTRAEDRLVVAGWQRRPSKDTTWYDLVAQGFSRLEGCREGPFEPAGFGAPAACRFAGEVARRLDCPQEAPPRPDGGDTPSPGPAELPAWTRIPAAPEIAAQPLSPSALPGEQGPAAAPHGPADPGGRRFRRGRVVHALLQHLPDRAPHEREAAARRFLARPGHGLTPAEQAETLAEVLALLDSPEVAEAFAPGSLAEAPLAGTIGGRLVSGQVDRLVVTSARVLVLDYKTNRPPPDSAGAVAPVYLRQMAAYRTLLRQVWPGRQVDCALVWTYGARLMMLPHELLDRHAPAA